MFKMCHLFLFGSIDVQVWSQYIKILQARYQDHPWRDDSNVADPSLVPTVRSGADWQSGGPGDDSDHYK